MKNPILILGKGPTAFECKPNDKLDIAVVNNGLLLCPKPTYSVFNDIEPMCLMEDEYFKKVKTMIVPTFLHSQYNLEPNKCIDIHFEKLYKLFPGRYDHINFKLYELHEGDNLKREEQERTGKNNSGVPSLGTWPHSVGGTAVLYLSLFEGYTDFILAGFDSEGGYHPIFKNLKPTVTFSRDANGNHIPAKVNKDTYNGPTGAELYAGQASESQPANVYPTNLNKMKLWASNAGSVVHIKDLSLNKKKEFGMVI